MRRSQRTFRPDNNKDRRSCWLLKCTYVYSVTVAVGYKFADDGDGDDDNDIDNEDYRDA